MLSNKLANSIIIITTWMLVALMKFPEKDTSVFMYICSVGGSSIRSSNGQNFAIKVFAVIKMQC